LKDGNLLKQTLLSNQMDVLAPMRLPCAKFLTKDCQVVVCSPRQLTELERNAIREGPNVITAVSDAVHRCL
jgi:actin-like ATPase involved in cell morphogenesis